jgi:hypothetical protein
VTCIRNGYVAQSSVHARLETRAIGYFNPVRLSVTVKHRSFSPNPLFVSYHALVGDGFERITIDVQVRVSAPQPHRAETAIKRRIARELNEMPRVRRWPDYLKELEPIELTARDA